MKITTEKEKYKLYRTDAYKKMLSEKGRIPENWNWQLRELKQAKDRANFSNSQVVQPSYRVAKTDGTQNGIEMLDSCFSEVNSADKASEPTKGYKKFKRSGNVDVLVQK